MTNDQTVQAKYADRIAKLLRKAESTTPEEAEALVAKAQALMTQYAIDEIMLAQVQGRQLQDEIVEETIQYTGIFMTVILDVGFTIARFNDCRGFFSKHDYAKPKRVDLHVIGYKSDVERVRLLDASLQIQCSRALTEWRRTSSEALFSKMESFKQRRQFIVGFNQGLSSQLAAARRAGLEAAAQTEAQRSKVAADVATQSVALVLRDRKSQVDDWYDRTYGRSLRKVSRRYSSGGASAHSAGVAAGRSADTGKPSVGGSGKAIGRG